MKKILAFLLSFIALFACGCAGASNKAIPSFEELLLINTYDNILKKHENFYAKNLWHDEEIGAERMEELVLMQGESKIDYHVRNKNLSTDEEQFRASRIGNAWYYTSADLHPMGMLELGELSILDDYLSTLPEILYGTVVGRGYVENGQIVYHTFHITEGTEDFPARRTDVVYYFNRKTKFIEKMSEVVYTNEHKVMRTYNTEFAYDVEVEEIFPTTLYGEVQSAENCINLEIIIHYGTEEQQSYTFVATPDMQVLVAINYDVYELYTDCEFTNKVTTLDEFEGQQNLTLYAKFEYEF